jgi:hypothetical protein
VHSHHHQGSLWKQNHITLLNSCTNLQLWNTNHAPTNVKGFAKHQLNLWGLEKFDLYLIHFPIALKYVPADVKFPAEWENPSGKVELGKKLYFNTKGGGVKCSFVQRMFLSTRPGRLWRSSSTKVTYHTKVTSKRRNQALTIPLSQVSPPPLASPTSKALLSSISCVTPASAQKSSRSSCTPI